MMSDVDNDAQMIFGDLEGLNLLDICLTGEEKPRKISLRKPVPTRDRTRACCVTGTHTAAWPGQRLMQGNWYNPHDAIHCTLSSHVIVFA